MNQAATKVHLSSHPTRLWILMRASAIDDFAAVQPQSEQARQHFENAFQRIVEKRNAADDATYGQSLNRD